MSALRLTMPSAVSVLVQEEFAEATLQALEKSGHKIYEKVPGME
jgi:hypothetical protein